MERIEKIDETGIHAKLIAEALNGILWESRCEAFLSEHDVISALQETQLTLRNALSYPTQGRAF